MNNHPDTPRASLLAGTRVGFGLLLAFAAPAFADMNDSAPPPRATPASSSTANEGGALGQSATPASELARGDRRFFRKASELGEREVALSRAASRHAVDPRVRSFADEMVHAHGEVNKEVAALARRKGAVLAEWDATERRAQDKKWAEKKADDFDKDYVDAMIDAHEDTIDVLENGVDSKDPEIAALANRLLPTVKAHLARAEALEDALD